MGYVCLGLVCFGEGFIENVFVVYFSCEGLSGRLFREGLFDCGGVTNYFHHFLF